MSHAFFKNPGFSGDYFPDMDYDVGGATVTVNIASLVFDQPVDVVMDTLILHTQWSDQVDDLRAYSHVSLRACRESRGVWPE